MNRKLIAILIGAGLLGFQPNTAFAQQAVTPESQETETIEVRVKRKNYYTEVTEDTQKLLELPGTLGDPIAAITTLPGVTVPAGGSEPAVRGSSPNDNRYYIDDMPAGYIFHAFNTSIFDEHTVQDFQIYTSGFGAQYSGATGAVFDIRLREPKAQPIETTFSASALRAGLFVEGQISENAAFYLSGRYGLIHLFVPEEDEEDEETGVRVINAPEDSDYLFKTVWDLSDRDQLTLNLIGATDYAEAEFSERSEMAATNPDFAGEAMLKEGFDSQGLTWEHLTNWGASMKLIATHSKDVSDLEWGEDYFQDIHLSNYRMKAELIQPVGERHTLLFGAEYSDTQFAYDTRAVQFICTEFDVDCSQERREVYEESRSLTDKEKTLYLIDFWQVTQDLSLELGIQRHYSSYMDETHYNPRAAVSWYFTDSTAVTVSAGRYNRFPDVHTVLPEIGNPKLQAPTAKHYTLGFEGEVAENWDWSIEGYYKELSRLPLGLNETEPDSELLYVNGVEGEVRGLDLFLNRNLADNWYGWLSLSYSQSERTNTRTGMSQDYRFDTPVVFNLVANYQFGNAWSAGFRFIANSGQATTKITGVRENPNFPDSYVAEYGEPYEDRLPPYVRLDLRAQKEFTLFGHPAKFFVDVLNALNRENVNQRRLDYDRVQKSGGELFLTEDVDMGIFPSAGISFTF